MTIIPKSAVIVSSSPYSVDDTLKRLLSVLEEKNIHLFACISHSEEARIAKLDLKDEVIVMFGDPKVGTYLMQENPMIGIELPLKILIWKDSKDVTKIGYRNPLDLKDSYNIRKGEEILVKMSEGLFGIVQKAISS
jgi:uncharacterized protein (DUF302 family)